MHSSCAHITDFDQFFPRLFLRDLRSRLSPRARACRYTCNTCTKCKPTRYFYRAFIDVFRGNTNESANPRSWENTYLFVSDLFSSEAEKTLPAMRYSTDAGASVTFNRDDRC